MGREHARITRRGTIFIVILLAVVVLAAVLFRSSTDSKPSAGEATPAPTAQPSAGEAPAPPTSTTVPTPEDAEAVETTTDEELTLGLPSVERAMDVRLAPLGAYIVAREGAGIRRAGTDQNPAPLEIPVYTTPFGPPRALLDVDEIDGVTSPVQLVNWERDEGALVMRVIAGGPDDEWLKVQAPTRPHNQYVWVRSSDFDYGFTQQRIEIDLAGPGELVLYNDNDVLLRSGIVQGRDARPTPVHLTYIERGIYGRHGVTPAYGSAVLSMASFSETLGTFGGGLPSNFIHGTNQPELMGQRVSAGEIRVPNDKLDQLISLIRPGTPVLIYDSSDERPGRASILVKRASLAQTTGFLDATTTVQDHTTFVTPQIWRRCDPTEMAALNRLLCPMRESHMYLVAKEGAGVFDPVVGANVIPVFDEPGGPPRTLVFDHPGNGFPMQVPLGNPTPSGQPVVLLPIERPSGGGWIRVLAPTYPAQQAVWVRAEHFDTHLSNLRIEIDIARPGELRLYDGEDQVLTSPIVYGRESRPTPLGVAYVDAIIDGPSLSPAYGPYVVSIPLFNEKLGTFSGVLAMQQIHGTDQPEPSGQAVSSGHIRLPNEMMTALAEDPRGLLGALVITFDSSSGSRTAAIEREQGKPWIPAETIEAETPDFPFGQRPN